MIEREEIEMIERDDRKREKEIEMTERADRKRENEIEMIEREMIGKYRRK